MFTIHFPRSKTEEEEILLKKYAKLRKKKKALQALRTPKPDPSTIKEAAPTVRSATESAEIKEDIKKLVKAGAIRLDSDRHKKAFKRKTKDPDKTSASVGFQPFEREQEKSDVPRSSKEKIKRLYDSFVPGADSTGRDAVSNELERPSDYPDRRPRRDYPKKGNTICINGCKVTEAFVREEFSDFGTIVNINMEEDKNRSFLTFDSDEAADKAIKETNHKLKKGIYLRVSLARRQPSFETKASGDAPSSTKTVWGSMAANRSQKGDQNLKDSRELVVCDADDIF